MSTLGSSQVLSAASITPDEHVGLGYLCPYLRNLENVPSRSKVLSNCAHLLLHFSDPRLTPSFRGGGNPKEEEAVSFLESHTTSHEGSAAPA